jgi:hypothetical protein
MRYVSRQSKRGPLQYAWNCCAGQLMCHGQRRPGTRSKPLVRVASIRAHAVHTMLPRIPITRFIWTTSEHPNSRSLHALVNPPYKGRLHDDFFSHWKSGRPRDPVRPLVDQLLRTSTHQMSTRRHLQGIPSP